MNVRVLMLEPPTDLLEERARKGLDRWDEMWDADGEASVDVAWPATDVE